MVDFSNSFFLSLPDQLITKTGNVETTKVLAGKKLILFYFSASWCPPCQQFTPYLAEVYEEWKNSENDFEIIFVSNDKDETSFNNYLKKMPWYAIDFKERDALMLLSYLYPSKGIPHLVVVNQNGYAIDNKGVEKVSKDPIGCLNAWLKKVK